MIVKGLCAKISIALALGFGCVGTGYASQQSDASNCEKNTRTMLESFLKKFDPAPGRCLVYRVTTTTKSQVRVDTVRFLNTTRTAYIESPNVVLYGQDGHAIHVVKPIRQIVITGRPQSLHREHLQGVTNALHQLVDMIAQASKNGQCDKRDASGFGEISINVPTVATKGNASSSLQGVTGVTVRYDHSWNIVQIVSEYTKHKSLNSVMLDVIDELKVSDAEAKAVDDECKRLITRGPRAHPGFKAYTIVDLRRQAR